MTRPSKPTERTHGVNVTRRAAGHKCGECQHFPATVQEFYCGQVMAPRRPDSEACSEGKARP